MDAGTGLRTAYEAAKRSTCNIRKVGAVLCLSDGLMLSSSNGNEYEPCTYKRPDFCERDTSMGSLEYISCRGLCAETKTILNANFLDYSVVGSTLFTTGFPCRRCKDLIIESGIENLYFISYKHGAPRMHEDIYAAQMIVNGTKLYRLHEGRIRPLGFNHAFLDFASDCAVTSGESWLRMIFDEQYRESLKRMLTIWRQSKQKDPKDTQGLHGRILI